jgi:predicted unusual protein kinase regulating ubiquinone biosynthesis (AarF/ABC1/UbiB family)
LQDNVPPFETQTALRILEDNLGAPAGKIFAEFDEQPIAAASLGQVRSGYTKMCSSNSTLSTIAQQQPRQYLFSRV